MRFCKVFEILINFEKYGNKIIQKLQKMSSVYKLFNARSAKLLREARGTKRQAFPRGTQRRASAFFMFFNLFVVLVV